MWPPSIGRNGGRMKEKKKDVYFFNPPTPSDAEFAAIKRYQAEYCRPSSSDSRNQKKKEEQKIHFFNPPSYSPPSYVSPWPQSLTKYFRKPSGVPQPKIQNKFDGTLPEEKRMPHHGDRQPYSASWELAPSRTEAQTMDCENQEAYENHGDRQPYSATWELAPSRAEAYERARDHPSNSSTSQPFETNTAFDEFQRQPADSDYRRFSSSLPYAPQHRGTYHEPGDQTPPDEDLRPILPWQKDHPSNCPPWKSIETNTAFDEFERHSVASTDGPEDDVPDNREEEEASESDAPEYDQAEEEEAYEDEDAESSTPACSIEEMEPEIVDPVYEAALNHSQAVNDEINDMFDEDRSVELSSSREDPEMQELIDAYRSGDAAKKAEAMAEWMAKFEEKQKKNGSATTGIEEGDPESPSPARSMEEMEEEVVDPEYEAALNRFRAVNDKINDVFDEDRSVELSSSREVPEMQELIDAYRSGDAAKKAEAMAEWMTRFDEKQKKDSSATTGIEEEDPESSTPACSMEEMEPEIVDPVYEAAMNRSKIVNDEFNDMFDEDFALFARNMQPSSSRSSAARKRRHARSQPCTSTQRSPSSSSRDSDDNEETCKGHPKPKNNLIPFKRPKPQTSSTTASSTPVNTTPGHLPRRQNAPPHPPRTGFQPMIRPLARNAYDSYRPVSPPIDDLKFSAFSTSQKIDAFNACGLFDEHIDPTGIMKVHKIQRERLLAFFNEKPYRSDREIEEFGKTVGIRLEVIKQHLLVDLQEKTYKDFVQKRRDDLPNQLKELNVEFEESNGLSTEVRERLARDLDMSQDMIKDFIKMRRKVNPIFSKRVIDKLTLHAKSGRKPSEVVLNNLQRKMKIPYEQLENWFENRMELEKHANGGIPIYQLDDTDEEVESEEEDSDIEEIIGVKEEIFDDDDVLDEIVRGQEQNFPNFRRNRDQDFDEMDYGVEEQNEPHEMIVIDDVDQEDHGLEGIHQGNEQMNHDLVPAEEKV